MPETLGIETGSRPDGLTAPEMTRASAGPPSSPGKNACSTAAGRVSSSSAQPMAYGRPVTTTSTTGVPVARIEETSSRWTPGSSSDSESLPSPTVPRPKSPAWSPTTTIATSAPEAAETAAGKPERSEPSTSHPATTSYEEAPSSAWSASAIVGSSMPSGSSG